MCWIAIKKANNPVPYEFMETAQKKNKDGYGVSWYDNGQIHTFKTLSFKEFNEQLEKIEDKLMVIHLRATSAGTTCLDNVHPFTVPTGVMFHNGTISSLRGSACNSSDTNLLAQTISKCTFSKVADIAPILEVITGNTYNKLVFLNNDGTVDIINPQLGVSDPNGNWYSNNYHIKDSTFNVFVYGTLKATFSNHYWYMKTADYIDDATTVKKYTMIGKNAAFPYVVCEHIRGHNIKGELYEVDSATLAALDRLEGYPTHYTRQTIQVTLSDGTVEDALIYIKASPTQSDLEQEFIDEFKKPTYSAGYWNKKIYSLDDY